MPEPPLRAARRKARFRAASPGIALSAVTMHRPTPARKPSRSLWRLVDMVEKPVEWLIRICGWSSILAVVAIFVFIFKEAAPMVLKLDWIEFFTSTEWIPHPAAGNEPKFGALALMVGTFSTTGLALLFAVPLGLAAAVYVSEFATGKVKESLKIILELLVAIPSIVWGFIGLMVLGPIIREVTGAPQGTNLLNAGIILGSDERAAHRLAFGGRLAGRARHLPRGGAGPGRQQMGDRVPRALSRRAEWTACGVAARRWAGPSAKRWRSCSAPATTTRFHTP